jgi:ribose transport system ATP-binding protein
MMVGRELSQVYPKVEKSVGKIVYEARGIKQGKAVKNVSFDLKTGEIVGLFGLMGAGRTELVRCLFGVDKMDAGEIIFQGKPLKNINPEICIEHGIAFVTEDRRQEGLMMPRTVKENLVLVKLDKMLASAGMVSRKLEESNSNSVVDELTIKTYDKNRQAVKNLSGGNQQKVVLGKWIMRGPSMFILDEPTRGVDVGAKAEIYGIVNNMAKDGATILFISSEMEELMGVCDRIMVMSKGNLVADIPKGEYDQDKIINFALGGGN